MSEQPEVRTTEGVVQGRWRQGHAVFRGIPYAQPPVGALRFAAPAPPHRWEGTRQAVEFGPVVPLSLPIAVSPQGTDWLTLNVGTPDPGAAGLPVLVWIPVGGYLAAASSDPMYDPAALAVAGVVVVTINCRVGAEGFAFLDDAPPNRGFLDQIAALEWVQRNIAAFGGDPGQVTVGGVSAGAGSVAALLTMRSARGLFRRAIAHSVPGMHSTPRSHGRSPRLSRTGSARRPPPQRPCVTSTHGTWRPSSPPSTPASTRTGRAGDASRRPAPRCVPSSTARSSRNRLGPR